MHVAAVQVVDEELEVAGVQLHHLVRVVARHQGLVEDHVLESAGNRE